jgi:hypothetical protein
MAKMQVESYPFVVVSPLFTRDPPGREDFAVSVAGKALIHDSSAVIIQLLDIVTLCMLYSSNWDVNDLSAFFDL